ncbi:hypothetical protein PHSY_000705 [Pseudozyma hubeiensis SY62]|uniref:GYF domain-containing protein n=1 Tax=Pseudozyma hubeiensis (strain SY62) TaxID=1305764 RepID=R9NX82_PSEHS|nr:hypothetical protein PHSY_000705 [Pseudozyma hubeiensis SY62]GAC93142.1 hypothetical protein PHSY_000705 [Pseudozyma hubeiensis SY62]
MPRQMSLLRRQKPQPKRTKVATQATLMPNRPPKNNAFMYWLAFAWKQQCHQLISEYRHVRSTIDKLTPLVCVCQTRRGNLRIGFVFILTPLFASHFFHLHRTLRLVSTCGFHNRSLVRSDSSATVPHIHHNLVSPRSRNVACSSKLHRKKLVILLSSSCSVHQPAFHLTHRIQPRNSILSQDQRSSLHRPDPPEFPSAPTQHLDIMATSMQFGPEWMRKGPTSKSGGKEQPTSSAPSAATSPGTGPVTGNAAPSSANNGGKRNGAGNLSGPAPVVSPAVASPGAFSFAAAAAAATAQASDRNGTHASTQHGSSVGNDSDVSAGLLNGGSAALAKDKITREKLLSLYSSDRSGKTPSADPSPVDAVAPVTGSGPERSSSTSRRKGGSDRRPSAFAEFGGVGGGPLSPSLGSNEPRGLNARSTSGGSTGAFGSAATSNWDKTDKERPGLFQRASSGALAGVTSNSGSRPLSPSVSRDRFSGIQGGVLSGVAPPARKRMDSNDGGTGTVEGSRAGRSLKGSQDETSAPQTINGASSGAMGGSWGRSAQSAQTVGTGGGVLGAFSDAFSSNRVRGRNASAVADPASQSSATATPASATVSCVAAPSSAPVAHSATSQPIVPSANPEGLSISARFARHKDRLPGEGPIGPPSDGSIGFGKASGFDRRRERQTTQTRSMQSHAPRGDAAAANASTAAAAADASSIPAEKANVDQVQHGTQNAATADFGLASDDTDLAQHASAVLGSLKLDDDDSPGLPSASALAQDQRHAAITDDGFPRERDLRDRFDQSLQPHSGMQSTAPWSPESSMWLYRDMAGNVQGPFSSLMMQDWYSQQYFADDLLIKRQEDGEFKPLAQVVSAIGNAMQPFVIPPSSWLHPPALPRSAFDGRLGSGENLLGTEQSRFSDTFDRSWQGSAGRHQQQSQEQQQPQQPQQPQQHGWPAPLSLGGLGSAGPSPASPFGRPDMFSANQSGMRNQDDLMSILRERELHEQRQAAAAAASRGPGGMHLGQLDTFGGGLGRSGWGNESAMTPSQWTGIGHAGLGHFGDGGVGGRQSPLVGDRAVFDGFGHQQRQNFDQAGSPWSNKASLNATRSQFDPIRPTQHGQWAEQQAPWSHSATTPDVNNRQMDFTEAMLRNEAIKAADPIGTPRRARSPAPQHDMTQSYQQSAEQRDEMHKSFENAFPAPVADAQSSFDSQASAAPLAAGNLEEKASAAAQADVSAEANTAVTPQKKQNKKEAQKAAAAAAAATSAAQDASVPAKTIESDIPPPEAFTAHEPRPEELWPQSPKAVEFASEPELSGMPALTLPYNKSAKDAKRESRSALQRQTSDAFRVVPGSGEPVTRTAAAATARSTAAGNVRVVSQEQFRRNVDGASTATQAPLSDWLNDANVVEATAPASRPAPWAAAKEDATAPTGPSLREIQEAEAKRAEARRAAEKAAARARMVASPSAGEELPTTLSWGLASAPASKNVGNAAAGSGNDAASASPAAPAWNAGKTAPKKTLMEIQEEERKRAEKVKAQQAAQAIALRKGYADSASRSTSASNLHGAANAAAAGGGAWSVVGASGKPSTPSGTPSTTGAATGGALASSGGFASATASPLASRPTTASRTASPSIPASTSGSAWSVVGNKPPAAAPASPSPATRISPSASALLSSPSVVGKTNRAADPNAPSAEFIRYCKDNLQGLTIKTDDFIDMLLQFPLDPSADVIEIIAETVYANSSTLDGRRFASDFVSKRKMDVQGRTGGGKWGQGLGGMGAMGSAGLGVKKVPVMGGEAKVKPQGGVVGSDAGFKVVKGKGAKGKR